MRRQEFLKLTGLGALTLAFPSCLRETRKQTPSRPNVLFIFTDQQHRYALGCMDNPDVRTPHLDRLAGEGVLFASAYSAAPVCGPFRGTLFTGRFPSTTGLCVNEDPLPVDGRNLAEVLERGGYHTSYVGKWHLGGAGNKPIPRELRGGFSDFIGYQCYNGFIKDVCFYDEENREHRFDRHRTEVTTDLAIERLGRASRQEKPFAMFVSYQSPHYPEQPAPEFEEMYSGKPMTKRPNYREVDPYTPTISPPSPRPFTEDPDFRKYGNDMDEYMRLYYAMCTQVDSGVGRLIEELKRLGEYKNTIIFYTSDHGDLQGAHGLKNKNLPWEESSGIPLIVRIPGQKGGRVCREAVDSTSFYPTILDWAGMKEEGERSDGISLVPYLKGRLAGPSFPAFAERKSSGGGSWRMVCLDGFKFVTRYGKDGTLTPEALFNLAEDPCEMNNRLDDSGFRTVLERLFAMVEDWHSGVPIRTIRYRELKNE